MSVSLNSVVGFNSTLQGKYLHGSRPKAVSLSMLASRIHTNERRRGSFVSATDNDRLVTDTSVKGGDGSAESSISDNQPSTANSSSDNSPGGNSVSGESGPQTSGASNGSTVSAAMKFRPKRSPLTARERLKAARLSRYTESKASKSEMGSKVLDALRESDKGKKRSGLPEAPENLFDDSKRGMPKDGWTFQFPGGSELFFIVVSFVLISTIMFATTYVVWKVGAIHFDEY